MPLRGVAFRYIEEVCAGRNAGSAHWSKFPSRYNGERGGVADRSGGRRLQSIAQEGVFFEAESVMPAHEPTPAAPFIGPCEADCDLRGPEIRQPARKYVRFGAHALPKQSQGGKAGGKSMRL